MSKTQIQQIVVVLLLVAFVGFWTVTGGDNKKGPRGIPASAPRGSALLPKRPAPVQVQAPAWDLTIARNPFQLPAAIQGTLDQKERVRQLALLQRPTEPEAAPEPEMLVPVVAPPLRVQGLMLTKGKPQAIVNRKVLSVGDVIEEAKILAITLDSITVLYHEKEFTLTIQNPVSGTTPSNPNAWESY